MSSSGTASFRQSGTDNGMMSNAENGLSDGTAEKAVEEKPAPVSLIYGNRSLRGKR